MLFELFDFCDMKARVLALYLPQYHPIPENDVWWGPGFTEWTNVGKAKKLFRGHYQPRVPADLGYYDLRVPETRQAQADMARKYGVEGFIYWHYWFGGGKRLMEKIVNEVIASGKPDFPFALAWANHSWRGFTKIGATDMRNLLQEQCYLGVEDYTQHFYAVLPALRDSRYIMVDGKPLFMLFAPFDSPEVVVFMNTWRELAVKNGLKGIHFVGQLTNPTHTAEEVLALGFDAVNTVRLLDYNYRDRSFTRKVIEKLNVAFRHVPRAYPYKMIADYFVLPEDEKENYYPTLFPDWDHTPRNGPEGMVLTGTTPELFGETVKRAVAAVAHKDPEHRIIVIKSWNEWAEGNYMEPDLKWGHQYLEQLYRYIKD